MIKELEQDVGCDLCVARFDTAAEFVEQLGFAEGAVCMPFSPPHFLAFDVAAGSANRAVISPEWADRPARNGVVIVPKLAMTPLLCDAASADALLTCSASRRRSDAQAAAAPIGPKMPVGCLPLRRW